MERSLSVKSRVERLIDLLIETTKARKREEKSE
jgi:hypothetical protein